MKGDKGGCKQCVVDVCKGCIAPTQLLGGGEMLQTCVE